MDANGYSKQILKGIITYIVLGVLVGGLVVGGLVWLFT
jgi:hypothetical protein